MFLDPCSQCTYCVALPVLLPTQKAATAAKKFRMNFLMLLKHAATNLGIVLTNRCTLARGLGGLVARRHPGRKVKGSNPIVLDRALKSSEATTLWSILLMQSGIDKVLADVKLTY